MLLAEQLVGEARERRKREMNARERRVDGFSAALYLATAIAIALLVESDRSASLPLVAGLVVAYIVVGRVRFEIGDAWVSAEQLVFIPMLVLLPLEYVPLLAAVAGLGYNVPEFISGNWHRERWVTSIGDCWFSVGPVLVLAILAPGVPTLADGWIFILAYAAQLLSDFAWGVVRDRLVDPLPLAEVVRGTLEAARVDAIVSPLAFVVGEGAIQQPWVLLVIGPLVWLLEVFSHDRRQRYTATLELNRAYRGTVMLLADVVEFDDSYTADHSRSVVELVQAVADEMDMDQAGRQELEFAALLHDVGKISIPNEILNKPAKLSREEFEVMKTHTIEGQFMLDRIGGLLGRVGEIVRSCHERWDGGGYPDGLAGEEIPLEARIVFACDAYNAMTTDRPYRKALASETAIGELVTNAGTQFDPEVVGALANVVRQAQPELYATEEVRALLASVQLAQPLGKPA